MAVATKTILKRLTLRKPEWFLATQRLFNQVVAFYFGVIQAHERVLELTDEDELSRKHTVGTIGTGAMSDPYTPVEAQYNLR